jgi:hypothetical protein
MGHGRKKSAMMERICKWEMGGAKRRPRRTDDGMVPIQLNPVMNPAGSDAIAVTETGK